MTPPSTEPNALCSALPHSLSLANTLSRSFKGFSEEAFAALERLREAPHLAQFREDKPALDAHVFAPFKRYRDDLAVNLVLPNHLPFETERGVFSRIPKNDFGAGGAHHHLWMAFYRPPRRRLSDVQLSHSLYPDRFAWGLYLGEYAGPLFQSARGRLAGEPQEALALLNPLLAAGYRFSYARRVTRGPADPTYDAPLDAIPEGVRRASGIWVRTELGREEAIRMGPDLLDRALEAQVRLWPLYRWLATAEGGGDGNVGGQETGGRGGGE